MRFPRLFPRLPKVQPALHRFSRDERGAAVVAIAVSMVVLVGAAGLAFDAGRGYMINARLSQAVDAAALAGGRSLSIGAGGDYETAIKKYFKANFPDGFMGATVPEPTIRLNAAGDEIEVIASATIPTTLTRVLDTQEIEISARAVVHRAVKGLEVALVLDNSGSMGRNGKMGDLQTSANLLLDILYGGHDTVEDLSVALVPFTGRSNLNGHVQVHPDNPPNPDRVCLDPRTTPHHTDDANPTEAPFNHYSGDPPDNDYEGRVCPEAAVVSLEESKSTLSSAINAMQAEGCTRYDVGTVWGWRTISPNWDGVWGVDGSPLPYEDLEMEKAIIIMTDGKNTPDCVGDSESRSQTETMFANVCADMKAVGVVIYTITFKLDDADTNQLFRDCASGEARYFKSPNSDELEAAFTAIANDLSTLRLSE